MSTADTFDFENTLSDTGTNRTGAGLLLSLLPIVLTQLREVVDELGEEQDTRAIEFAEKQAAGIRQTHQFDAARWLKQHHSVLATRVREEFNNAFRHAQSCWLTPPDRAHLNISLSALSLLGDAEMEESLAVANLANKSEHIHSEQLPPLLQRLNTLPNCYNFTEQTNPFGSYPVAEALRMALMSFKDELSQELRLALLKCFEQFVIPELGEMYSQLNARLAEAGVLPDLHVTRIVRQASQSRRRASEKPAHESDAAVNPHETDRGGGDANVSATTSRRDVNVDVNEVFGMLQQLLTVHRGDAGQLPAVDESGQPITRGGYQPTTLVSAVSLVQHRHRGDEAVSTDATTPAAPIDIAEFKKQLLSELRGDDPSSHTVGLSQLDEDTIDIVGNLFDVILEDPHLAEPIKAQIIRLQIPLLKVALLDKSFFADSAHPARRLINQLARAGTGWVQDENYKDDSLYLKITQIVGRVLEEFDHDLGLFTTLLDDLSNFCTAAEGNNTALRDQLETTHNAAHEAIEAHLSHHDVPQGIANFCRTAWLRYLVQLHSRHGAQSAPWENALDVLKNLLWSVQPKKEVTEKRLMAMMIPQLITDLEAGMTAIEYSTPDSQSFLGLLQDIHLTSLRGKTALKNTDTVSDTAVTSPAPDTAKATAIAELMAMPLGGWAEFQSKDGKRRRGRLVWRDVFTSDLTFVDWRFKVIVDANVARLADDLINGQLRLLADAPLFDRAITALMNKMKTLTAKRE